MCYEFWPYKDEKIKAVEADKNLFNGSFCVQLDPQNI